MILALSGSLRRASVNSAALRAAAAVAARSGITVTFADVVHRSLPISNADRDTNGEIASPEIAEELRAIVSELAARAAGSPPRDHRPLSSRSAPADAATA